MSEVRHQSSMLMAGLFEGLDETRRLTVLDLGAASPESLEFFSDYKCRLYFADLYAEPLPRNEEGDLDELALSGHFHSLLALPDDARIDVCLFWDYLNYLPEPAVRALMLALSPYLLPTTRAHGFGVRSSSTKLESLRYGICTLKELCIRTRSTVGSPSYAHTQAALKRLLDGMDVSKVLLMPDGRLEMLFHALDASRADVGRERKAVIL